MKTYEKIYLAEFFVEWEMFQIEVVQKSKTHVQYFFPQNYDVYEMMWKNMLAPDRPQMTIY
jgi:hypothetical protein